MQEVPVTAQKSEYRAQFKQDLTHLINSYSLENDSNTPDYIIAEYLCACLDAYEKTAKDTTRWFGR